MPANSILHYVLIFNTYVGTMVILYVKNMEQAEGPTRDFPNRGHSIT